MFFCVLPLHLTQPLWSGCHSNAPLCDYLTAWLTSLAQHVGSSATLSGSSNCASRAISLSTCASLMYFPYSTTGNEFCMISYSLCILHLNLPSALLSMPSLRYMLIFQNILKADVEMAWVEGFCRLSLLTSTNAALNKRPMTSVCLARFCWPA